MQQVYDIVIAGGGLVGSSLAIALSGQGYRIAVLEPVPRKQAGQPSYDDRTLALSLASCRILEALGVWPGVRGKATAIQEIQIRATGAPGSTRLRASEFDLPWFGQVIYARLLGEALQARLASCEDIDFICPASLVDAQFEDRQMLLRITTEQGDATVQARLLVGADGANSTVRGLAGIPTNVHDYRQTAIISNLSPEMNHNGVAFEKFTRNGPLALLPMPAGVCGMVWSQPDERVESVMHLSDTEFLEQLQKAFSWKLGRFKRVGKRMAYPLKKVIPERLHQGRVLLVGNAAHSIHPVSAQGFNLGLRDAAVLAQLLRQENTRDPGDEGLLTRYSSMRSDDQNSIVSWTDSLLGFFGDRPSSLRWAAALGLVAFDRVPMLKRRLVKLATGYRYSEGPLFRGESL